MNRLGLLLLVLPSLSALIVDAEAQNSEKQTGELELRIDPQGVENGIPQAFDIFLVNNTDHDVRLPMPVLGCPDYYSGNVGLVVHFAPLWPDLSEPAHSGCGESRARWPAIIDRIKEWKIVHPGAELNLLGTLAKRYLNDQMPGAYEVWGAYTPPFLNSADEKTLRDMGIDFPPGELSSPHAKFKIQPVYANPSYQGRVVPFFRLRTLNPSIHARGIAH